MSVAINRVIIAGNLTRDPELKTLEAGRVVTRLSIAINRHWRNGQGERKDEVTYIDCEAWGRSAELAGQYLTKGSPCLVEGRLKMDQWESQDGKKQSRLKVVADNIQFLSNRGEQSSQDGYQAQRSPPTRVNEGPSLEESLSSGAMPLRPHKRPTPTDFVRTHLFGLRPAICFGID